MTWAPLYLSGGLVEEIEARWFFVLLAGGSDLAFGSCAGLYGSSLMYIMVSVVMKSASDQPWS